MHRVCALTFVFGVPVKDSMQMCAIAIAFNTVKVMSKK